MDVYVFCKINLRKKSSISYPNKETNSRVVEYTGQGKIFSAPNRLHP